MAYLAKTICNYSRCSAAVPNGQRYCKKHLKEKPENKAKSHPWYHIPAYRNARSRFVKDNPRCACCNRLIQNIADRHLDHIVPWQSGASRDEQWRLFWDKSNWQTLYKGCHSSKTRSEQI